MKQKWNGNAVIDRYIYDVVRRLPQNQRKEVEAELRSMIEDTLEPLDPKGNKDRLHVEKVLYELGKPSLLATKYRGEPRYLIGPAYFDEYVLLLKIVVPIVVSVLFVIGSISIFFAENMLQAVIEMIAGVISGGIQALAWVTAVMAAISYFGDKKDSEEWHIDDLPQIEDHSNVINRTETIVGLIFMMIGIGLWLMFAHKIGIYIMGDTINFIPMFHTDVLSRVQYLAIVVLLLEVVLQVFRLVEGRWTLRLIIVDAVINTVTFLLGLAFVQTEGLFHNAFYQQLQTWLATAEISMSLSWPAIISFFLIVTYIAEMAILGVRFVRSRKGQ